MPELPSPWREVVTLLIGGGAYKFLDWYLAYRKQRSDLQLAAAHLTGEEVGNLERRVTATVKVIDIYQDTADDFAERIKSLRAENRALKRENGLLRQENTILREMKDAPGPLAGPGDGKGNYESRK